MSELAETEGLLENLNIVIVSDHGMASMNNKTYLVKDVVDINLINQTKSFFGIVSNIYPKNINDVCIYQLKILLISFSKVDFIFLKFKTQKIYDSFKKLQNFSVYFREEVPKSFHFDSNERIGKNR